MAEFVKVVVVVRVLNVRRFGGCQPKRGGPTRDVSLRHPKRERRWVGRPRGDPSGKRRHKADGQAPVGAVQLCSELGCSRSLDPSSSRRPRRPAQRPRTSDDVQVV